MRLLISAVILFAVLIGVPAIIGCSMGPIPHGATFEFVFDGSKIFPGTSRTLQVYIPAQYRGDKPACVYVGLDGLAFNAAQVFDGLISRGEMPVTIAIGLPSGSVASAVGIAGDAERANHSLRYNRSYEFDGLSGSLAMFLLQEVFPEVERKLTPDGLPILLSKDPNDRAVGGFSTGGIGAFTLAWERPDSFRRVFTSIATFVGMRGGDRYPVLIRKTEPKPIRIFMQDGANDQYMGSPEVGDWWMSNQTVERALSFAGYQVKHMWGDGGHDGRDATKVFPDAMRWLWEGWPGAVTVGKSHNTFLQAILLDGESWELVTGDYRAADIITADVAGQILFRDPVLKRVFRIAEHGPAALAENLGIMHPSGLASGSDGRIYWVDQDRDSVLSLAKGEVVTVAREIRARQLVVTHQGNIYAADPVAGKVWLVRPTGEKVVLDSGLDAPTAIAVTPDGSWLAVAESRTHIGYSYRILPDGLVDAKQRYYHFHVPDDEDGSDVGGWVMDQAGHLFSATNMGVQVFDRNGRVRAILPVPGGAIVGIAFGGPSRDVLHVASADHKVYRRKLKTVGFPPWGTPTSYQDEGGA